MSVFRQFIQFFMVTLIVFTPLRLSALELAPFKDELFGYPKILDAEDGGDYLLVKYDKQVDLYDRDEIPIRKAKRKYIRLGLRRHLSYQDFEFDGRSFDISVIGKKGASNFAVIFIHGRNGDRKLGMNDYSFGGNFNRIKNLAVRNNGLYITQTVREFSSKGSSDTSALIRFLHDQQKVKNIVLVCASMGGQICNRVAQNHNDVARLSGMVMLGALPDKGLARSHAAAVGLPIVIAHGNDDVVYPWTAQRSVYKALKARTSRYPVQFIVFDTGRHGTPIRMFDWRASLNWIFKRS